MIQDPRTNSEDLLREDSIFRIGRVVSVEGRIIKVKVDKAKNTSHLIYRGEPLKNISVGGYIKICKGFTRIVGKVEGEYISEERDFRERSYKSTRDKVNRILSVSLLGFFTSEHFERGIKELPLIDNECFLLRADEFCQVHDFLRNNDEPITIGTLALEKGQAINVGVNSLSASHIGIFGNTGSGKSYTLAKIYFELFRKYRDHARFRKNASFFLLDFNGEYATDVGHDDIIVEKRYKNVLRLSTRASGDRYPLEREVLYDPTFWAVLSEATEKTQTPFLRRALKSPPYAIDPGGDKIQQSGKSLRPW